MENFIVRGGARGLGWARGRREGNERREGRALKIVNEGPHTLYIHCAGLGDTAAPDVKNDPNGKSIGQDLVNLAVALVVGPERDGSEAHVLR